MTERLLREGRLEQTCRECGRMEAAGPYCTGCLRPTTEADWYRNGDLDTRAERRGEMPSPPVKRGRGRPRRVAAPTESA
jgi:hypothetical protein